MIALLDLDISRKLSFFNICFSAGYPKEMAESYIGVKTTMKIIDLGDSRLACHITVEGRPEMNHCNISKEGIDNHINSPHFGGKCVLTYHKSGNGYKSVIKTEKMGTWSMDEEYTEAGIKIVSFDFVRIIFQKEDMAL